MRALPAASIEACVTDPPYGIAFMSNAWDSVDMYAFSKAWGSELLRVLKPGAHALVFGGTRTYHRMVCALEDVGFEVRDCMMWLYGSGFPKSLDVSKAIDERLGLLDERPVVQQRIGVTKTYDVGATEPLKMRDPITAAASEKAREWQGWGTGLKPAWEPIAVLRKPLERTVAENVLAHRVGAINIDACRIPFRDEADREDAQSLGDSFEGRTSDTGVYQMNVDHSFERSPYNPTDLGRWPANLLLDPVSAAMVDEQSGQSESKPGLRERTPNKVYGPMSGVGRLNVLPYADFGGASRFFYVAKASRSERDEGLDDVPLQVSPWQHDFGMFQNDPSRQPLRNFHPTVKPLDLVRYLVRLITPRGGVCFDPFLGSGTTLVACRLEGFAGLGFEKEQSYEPLIRKRLAHIPPALETFGTDEQSDGDGIPSLSRYDPDGSH